LGLVHPGDCSEAEGRLTVGNRPVQIRDSPAGNSAPAK
jgi:hypothetical protein